MTLIFILVGIFVWSYIQFFANYKKVELSRKMIEALLENKTDLAKDYAKQLGFVQENLDRTEDFLKDIKDENMKLREKIKLLDQLNDMEREIGRLREENVLIHKQMVEASYEFTSDDTAGFKFDTIEKGRLLIKKFKQKFRGIKERIHFLKEKEHKTKVAIQKEVDRKELLLGNNGYLMKDGQPMPVSMPDVENLPDDIKVKVKFVK